MPHGGDHERRYGSSRELPGGDSVTTTSPARDRVWFITGASRGLGRAFAEAALAAGDRVAAAARDTEALAALAADHPGRVLDLPLDVTDRAAVFAAVDRAADHFGRVDIVVNNAGTLSMGAVEEFTEAEARAQMEVNFFGALWVSQAALGRMRAQGAGHIVQVSSIGAVAGHASTGLYSASKFALEGMSEALAAEAARFGVRVSIVQPGGYWTELYTRMRTAQPMAEYDPMRAELEEQYASAGPTDSEPRLAAEAVLTLVDSDDPPRRLLLGGMVYDLAFDVYRGRMAEWERWEDVSRAAEHPVPPPEWLFPAAG
ncbi:SDR family NAD(P)-dependent oxidoreductase [Streptomonospora sp. NEAU-YY374]|nr:SDR family NAD(P)-dependent oxidoreductase [Streptomonospora nanhaiensis]MBV2366042.1 SDR family NAD(P)-dependent oxidoreductase [Streptomonospora nanhaiensis]